LFGNVHQAADVITYAASCGFTRYEMLSNEVKSAIQGAFRRISAFSVRDINTMQFVNSLTDKQPEIYLDPVAVGDFDKEIQSVNVENKLPKKYCIIYAYHDRINSSEEIKAITEFCKKHKLTPVTIGGYQKWVHNHLVLSPFEVLAAFKNADYVITDTFHGTIFSIKYAKRFAVIVRDGNRNKLLDLINRFGIQKHQLHKMANLEEVYGCVPNRSEIDEMVAIERNRTQAYLKENL
jgi:hypothetical protein